MCLKTEGDWLGEKRVSGRCKGDETEVPQKNCLELSNYDSQFTVKLENHVGSIAALQITFRKAKKRTSYLMFYGLKISLTMK